MAEGVGTAPMVLQRAPLGQRGSYLATALNVVIALVSSFVPRFVRLVRAETLATKEKSFVEAARGLKAKRKS